ncbi:MAG: sugar transferase [Sphingomonas bacterium]|nr:sugar transferase [Sphingomonas bacterium]
MTNPEMRLRIRYEQSSPALIFNRDSILRALDVVIAGLALVFLLPLMAIIAALVWMTDRGPIVFAHHRIGRGGRVFPCLKFRSMVTDSSARLQELLERDPVARAEWARDHKLKNDPRITKIGNFLRKSSFDELPQLINVLRGEMSLVGPRPIVDAEIPRYGRYFAHYCAVRPGITGLWQVSGRNDVNYRRRVAFDVIYGRNRSVRTNMRIIAATVPAVAMSRGSY